MHQAASEQKKQFGLQIDQQVKMQEMDLDQQFLQVLQYVKQQATRQRAVLEQQAMQLSFEYQEKRVEEDMLAHQFELAKHQQALRNQMLTNGPVSPLPSYLPVAGSKVQALPDACAQNRCMAVASDALAPVLAYAPLGNGSSISPGFTSTSYTPPVASAGPPITTTASSLPAPVSAGPPIQVPVTLRAPPVTMTTASMPTASVVQQPQSFISPMQTTFAPQMYQSTLFPQPSAAVLPTVFAGM